MSKVRKGVIVAAGLGTRFLPITKTVPKELLPVLNKPVLQYIVEEMAGSGIADIMIVIAPGKEIVKEYFAEDKKLEMTLKKTGKLEQIKSLREISKKVTFHYTYQKEPLGNGHALLQAKKFCGREPFAFSDGDSIIDARTPVVGQLMQVFEKQKASVIGVQKIKDKQEMTKYGNVYGEKIVNSNWKLAKLPITNYQLPHGLYKVTEIREKPSVKEVSPFGLIIGGMRYIFTPDIWKYMVAQKQGRGGEIWVADAVNMFAQNEKMFAYEYEGKYFDTGNEVSLLKTSVYFAMRDGAIEIKKILDNQKYVG